MRSEAGLGDGGGGGGGDAGSGLHGRERGATSPSTVEDCGEGEGGDGGEEDGARKSSGALGSGSPGVLKVYQYPKQNDRITITIQQYVGHSSTIEI